MYNTKLVKEEKIMIEDIPTLRFNPRNEEEEKIKTIIFYHGWSSDKETQKMRGYILASFGYQVLIPDSINHGERGKIDYDMKENALKYFWPTVINNIEEADKLIDYAKENLSAGEIGIMGNSMGGITTSGILVKNPDIKVGVVLNGSCNWKLTNKIMMEKFSIDENLEEARILEDRLNKYDPIKNKEKTQDKYILMLHGDKDEIVDIRPQFQFAVEMEDKNHNIQLRVYPRLNHLVTTNMMEDSIAWFNRYL